MELTNEANTQISEIGALKGIKYPRLLFVLFKLLPFAVYFIINKYSLNSTLEFIVFIFVLFADFYISKNVGGPELVGLGWYIATELDSTSFLQFLSKPVPFVPKASDTNLFWISFIFSIAVWIISMLFTIFSKSFFQFFLSMTGFILQAINLGLFIKAHSLLQIETAKIARSGMLDAEDPLNLAMFSQTQNDSDSSSDK